MIYQKKQEVKGGFGLAKEWIDVVDTAVKIGLGSIITGFFTFIGVKLSKKSEIDKHFIEHKTKVLESAMLDSHEYFSAVRTFISLLRGNSKSRCNTILMDYPSEDLDVLYETDDKLVSSWKSMESAIASLNLLGAHECSKIIEDVLQIEKDVRIIAVFDLKLMPFEELSEINTKINQAIENFQIKAAITYNSLYKK